KVVGAVLGVALLAAVIVHPLAALWGAGASAVLAGAVRWRGRRLASPATAAFDRVAHDLGLIRCPAQPAKTHDPTSPRPTPPPAAHAPPHFLPLRERGRAPPRRCGKLARLPPAPGLCPARVAGLDSHPLRHVIERRANVAATLADPVPRGPRSRRYPDASAVR